MKHVVLLLIIPLLLIPGAVDAAKKKKSKKVTSEAGLNIPAWGLAIDAVYNPKLDNLVPGYKIINVVLTNRSATIIYFNPKKDKWEIRDNVGKSRVAINHLRMVDDKLWTSLPPGLKEKLEYPQAVRVGHSAKIDLFFPESYELAGFREISWKSAHFKKEFNILTNMENDLEWSPKGETQKIESPSHDKAREKYEGSDKPEDEKPSFDPALDDFSISTD